MPRVTAKSRGDGVQAVVLTLRILEHLAAEQEPVGVTALAQKLGTTKSRIYRHLRTLVQEGYIVQVDGSEKYRAGSRLVSLGQAASEGFHLASIGRPVIRALRDDLGQFTVLSQPEREGMRVVATLSGKSAVETQVKPGSLLGFHYTAQGHVALAFGDKSLLDTVCRSKLEAVTPYTITSARALRAEVERVRRQGWATAPNEALVGSNTLAAPIFAANGELYGTVGLVGSVQYIPKQPSKAAILRVIAAAREISRALGTDVKRIGAALGVPAYAA